MRRPRVLLSWVAASVFAVLLVLLTFVVLNDPIPSQDQKIMDWVSSWDVPGLGGFFTTVSFLTNKYFAAVLGIVGVIFFFILGKTRAALEFFIAGAIVALIAISGDNVMREIIGRERPLGDNVSPGFPSGHVFGATSFFGFWVFLAIYSGLNTRILLPVVALFSIVVLAVGPARVYEKAHWPSDTAAGYLLGGLSVIVAVHTLLYLRRKI